MAVLPLLLQFAVYTLLRRLFSCVQYIVWLFTGTAWKRHLATKADHYDQSAQLMTVIGRHKFDVIAQPCGNENFVTVHDSFVHPRYVLRDNVTLYSVTDKHAVFVETSPDIDVTSLDVNCFMRIAQYEHAVKIILLPVSSVHKLAEEDIGEIPGELIFVTSTARCGSTLLCQIMGEIQQCRAFSEPDYFHIINAYKNYLRPGEMERLLRNCTRLLCKPLSDRPQANAFLIKPIAHFVSAVPLFVKVFPASHQLFMYRDSLRVTHSMLKMFEQVPISQVMVYVATYLPRIFRFAVSYSVHFHASDIPPDMCEEVEFGMFIWAVTCRCYKQLRDSGYHISALKYEHLVTHPLPSIRKILAYCNLPADWARTGVRAMGKDSQRGGLISIAKLANKGDVVLSVKNRRVMDTISDIMQVPRINKPCHLPNTINSPDNF